MSSLKGTKSLSLRNLERRFGLVEDITLPWISSFSSPNYLSTTASSSTTMSTLFDRFNQRLAVLISQFVSLFHLFFASIYPTLKLQKRDLSGKIALVTGANSGLGYSIALSLAEQGATVYLACRSMTKGNEAANDIINATDSKNVHVVELDTSSLESVKRFAAKWSLTIDYLMHNAGIATTPSDVKTTTEGLGLIYATNLAGAFLLTSLIEKRLAPDARVIFTSSTGAYIGDVESTFRFPRLIPEKRSDSLIYNDTKLMQIVFARALQERWDRLGIRRIANAFTPGYSMTPIFGKMPATTRTTDVVFHFLKMATNFTIPSEQGALTGVWLASSDDPVTRRGGAFWDRQRRMNTVVDFIGSGQLERIWQLWCVDTGAKWD